MKDFKGMIADAKKKHAERTALDEAAARQQRQEWDERHKRATGFLTEQIAPMLEAAKRDFAAEGVPLELSDNWSNSPGHPMLYSLEAVAVGPQRRNQYGGASIPKSITAFFQHDGANLKIGLGANEFASHPTSAATCSPEEAEAKVAEALAAVLESYYRSIEHLGR